MFRSALVIVFLASVTSCSNPDDAAARRAVSTFFSAFEAGDGSAACAKLAPKTLTELEKSAESPCGEAILDVQLRTPADAARVTAIRRTAEVRYDDQAVFLARFEDGWRITAVGCSHLLPDEPYDCEVQGG